MERHSPLLGNLPSSCSLVIEPGLPPLLQTLARWPITVLAGSRQAGKTTVVRELML